MEFSLVSEGSLPRSALDEKDGEDLTSSLRSEGLTSSLRSEGLTSSLRSEDLTSSLRSEGFKE